MRPAAIQAVVFAAALALAACQKPESASGSLPAATADANGQDPGDPDTATSPPSETREYTALSKTAMSVTGDLLIAPSPPTRPNLPPGATFTFSHGMALTTTELPGGASQGDPPLDWSAAFPTMKPGDIGKIEMYSVETERRTPGPAGGLCDKTTFIAALLDDAGTTDPKDDTLSLAAFSSNSWPPQDPKTALCGTFAYIPAE